MEMRKKDMQLQIPTKQISMTPRNPMMPTRTFSKKKSCK
jgi:hypothetical protein